MDGGFYSAYDADSEGHEGKFYVWTRTEVRAALTPLECSVFSRRFGLDEEPNFEGAWHAHVFVSFEQIAKELQLDAGRGREAGRQRARQAAGDPRQARVAGSRRQDAHQLERARDPRPRDRRARARQAARFAAAADDARSPSSARTCGSRSEEAAGCWPPSKDGVAHLNAYLDDYAYLANALLEMLQLRWRNEDVAWLRRDPRRDARALRRPAARRILLHLRRSRSADPSQQELQRRRDSRRQRHRGARADPRRLPVRRDALARRRANARCAPRGWRSTAFRTAT